MRCASLQLALSLCAASVLLNWDIGRTQTDVYLKAYTKTFQRMAIDLYPLSSPNQSPLETKISKTVTEVLRNDLWMSGYFTVNVRTGSPTLTNDGESGAAQTSSAIATIVGRFRVEGGSISLQPQVLDRASGRVIIRSTYRDRLGTERYLVHKIADDIVFQLTGERGIARSKIAFVTQKADGSKELALMDYDGHGVRELTANGSINLSPTWSPDGSKICYMSYRDGNPNLYIYDLRTETETRISALPGLNSAPAWSPDGKSLALTLSKDGNAEIYVLDLDSGQYRRLTYSRGIDSSPSWSPSNREIAFTSDRSGSPQIYIMDADGLNLRRLTFEGSYNDSPCWSPRGDKIAFVSRTDSGFDIYTIDVTGENLMRLTDSSGSNEDPSWSPNGFSLVFSSTRRGQKELFTMFWDGSDQKPVAGNGIAYSPAWSPRLK